MPFSPGLEILKGERHATYYTTQPEFETDCVDRTACFSMPDSAVILQSKAAAFYFMTRDNAVTCASGTEVVEDVERVPF